MITHKRVTELIEYLPEEGEFYWRETGKGRGDTAGHQESTGYSRICIDGVRYGSHRLAWFYVTGNWPEGQIDHINGDPSDNRFVNLRDVCARDNQRNQKRHSRNTSGVPGVTWDKHCSKWKACIHDEGKHKNLGRFLDWFDAVCARKSGEVRLGYHQNHGRI